MVTSPKNDPVFVFDWPEFIEFAKRLGVDTDRPTRKFRLTLAFDQLPVIEHEYFGEDTKPTKRNV